MNPHIYLGKLGENIGMRYLIKNGYLILFRNFKIGGYEIDLIVRNGAGVLIFCEVKTRQPIKSSYFSPEDSVSRTKLLKMARAAQLFEGDFPRLFFDTGWRIDLLAITILDGGTRFDLRHYKNV